jgi:hypothetical protein
VAAVGVVVRYEFVEESVQVGVGPEREGTESSSAPSDQHLRASVAESQSGIHQTGEFAVDAAVAPGRVVRRHVDDEPANLSGG